MDGTVELSREEQRAARSTLRDVGRFLLVLAVLACVSLAIVSQLGDLPEIDWRFQPVWLIGAIAAIAVLQFLHAAIWRRLVLWLHGDLEPARSRAIWSASNMGKYVPTSLLAWVMRISMAERAGVPRRVTSASVVYELALIVAASTAVGAYGVVVMPDLQGHAVRWLVLAVPLLALVAVHPRVFRSLGDAILRRAGSEPLPETLSEARVLLVAAWYAGSLVVAGLGTYAFARSLHPVDAGDVPTVIAAFSLALALSFVAFVLPAGLGAREAGFAAALAPALPPAVAVAVAIGLRLVQISVEVAYALITPWFARRRA
ncbi:MAG: lysylphosphatidylglycerol synthase domain-containing protein [Solirubrobacteraceae bacterium]